MLTVGHRTKMTRSRAARGTRPFQPEGLPVWVAGPHTSVASLFAARFRVESNIGTSDGERKRVAPPHSAYCGKMWSAARGDATLGDAEVGAARSVGDVRARRNPRRTPIRHRGSPDQRMLGPFTRPAMDFRGALR
jgi:hypothetical protein